MQVPPRRNTRRRGGRRASEAGAATIEFALVLPILVMLIFGTIQYGYYFFATQSASAAARDAARRSAVGDCAADADLTSYVSDKLGGLQFSSLDVDRDYSPAKAIGNTVTVKVTFSTMDLNFPFIPVPNDAQVSRTFDTRVENLDSGSCT